MSLAPSAPAAHSDTRMRAVLHTEYGEAHEVLRPGTSAIPTITDTQVLVKVHSAGVDRGVWHLITGLPLPVRLAGFGVRRPKNPIPGLDVAGTVVEVGSAVTNFSIGDEVFGVGISTFAEFAACHADKLAHRPANVTPRQAAVTAISGLTALQAVRDQGRVRAGQSVLVIGASGGVGSFAVQIAAAFGAQVTGVCSAKKVAAVSALGVQKVIAHEGGWSDGIRYDVIIDTGGNTPLRTLLRALTSRGTLVIVGGETGGRMLGGADRQLRGTLLSPFVKQRIAVFISSENAADIEELGVMMAAGTVVPLIDRSFALDEAGEAIRYLAEGNATGKVLISL